MNRSCLNHLLTETEREQFAKNGYLIIENALTPETLDICLAAVDRIDLQIRKELDYELDKRINVHDCIGKETDLLQLIDLPTTFPKVWGLMGWNIYLFHTQMVVSPPTGNSPSSHKRLSWHQDQNRSNGDLDTEGLPVNPMLSLKIAYFLTDTTEVGVANFYIAPGQQERNKIVFSKKDPDQPINTMPMQVPAGTAVLFDRRLWHASSPNYLDQSRKVLFYGYAYRWIRPKCIMDVDDLREKTTPIRRQLLGATGSQDGYYLPSEGDVPLRTWLQENSGEKFTWGHR